MDDDTAEPRPTVAPASRPPERYGDVRPPWHRVAARTVVGVALVAGLAWVVWAGLAQADRDVRWEDVGFSISGSTAVDVTFDVIKDPDATALCQLEALNSRYAVVGVAEVEVGPSAGRVVRLTETVQTQEQAVTGIVKSCAVP